MTVAGLILVCAAAAAPKIGFIAVPVALVGAFSTAVNVAFAFLFKKDVLCRIALWIDLAAGVLSVVSVIFWLAAL